MATAYFVGLDVGGTTMKAAVVDENGVPGKAVVSDTEPFKGQAVGLETMCRTIRNAVAAAGKTIGDIAAIGVATPGTMDIKAGLILDPPNLKPWRDVPVRQHIADAFKLPTAFQNDANAATFGEYWVGAGRNVESMVMFTLGTGIGGGAIIKDMVLEGQHSHGMEVGHMCIEMNGRVCGCGRHGCLEAYSSATSTVKRCKEALLANPGQSILHEILARNEAELTSRAIFDAANAGDTIAKKVVEDTAIYLAYGAMNMMHVIDPDMIVIGGGMTAAGEGFLNRIRHHICQLAFPVPASKTEVRYALLGSDAGFIGAANCGRQLWLAAKK